MHRIFDNLELFLSHFSKNLSWLDMSLNSYQLDHLAYRCETDKEGYEILSHIKAYSNILSESFVSWRKVIIVKLHVWRVYRWLSIDYIEILFPKPEKTYYWWDHIEFTVCEYTNDFVKLSESIQNYNDILKSGYSVTTKIHRFETIHSPIITITFSDNTAIHFNSFAISQIYH